VKFIFAAVFVLALPACSDRGGSASTAADSAAVMRAVHDYQYAWMRGDTTAALRFLSDDIRILIQGVADVNGKEAARKLFVDEMATYQIPSLTLTQQDVIVTGNHVITVGIWEETLVPRKAGAPIHAKGRFMTIWRKEGNDWRIVRYMLNDLEAPPPK
jgi:ketosteroid isomerase-like protein